MLFIGDVHGKYDEYLKIIANASESIQVGDMGFDYAPLVNVSENHRFIKGNHDNYREDHSLDLGAWGVYQGIGFLRGAKSVDIYQRVEGRNYFPEEELTYSTLQLAVLRLTQIQPRIMVSHDLPQSLATSFFGITDRTTTRNALEALWQDCKPNLWVFGHHHRSVDYIIEGTRFVGLNELETFQF